MVCQTNFHVKIGPPRLIFCIKIGPSTCILVWVGSFPLWPRHSIKLLDEVVKYLTTGRILSTWRKQQKRNIEGRQRRQGEVFLKNMVIYKEVDFRSLTHLLEPYDQYGFTSEVCKENWSRCSCPILLIIHMLQWIKGRKMIRGGLCQCCNIGIWTTTT